MENKRGTLAKLMAVENITVEHRQISTAAFDVINRTLLLPIWKEMSSDVYELLQAHEVGHALETPAEGWHGTVIKDKHLRSFLNVVEDARIEKLIKQRYPGLRTSFSKGYKELFDKDFFGAKNKPLKSLLLVDRINLHFKIGAYLNVPFNTYERIIVDEVGRANTWEDVVVLAKRIYNFDLEEFNKQIREFLADGCHGDGDLEQFLDEDQSENSNYLRDSWHTDQTTTNHQLDDWYEDLTAPESLTDKNFKIKESELVDDKCLPRIYVDIPKANLSQIIKGHATVATQFKLNLEHKNITESSFKESINFDKYRSEFLTRNTSFIDHMVREFEIKRNARQLARAGIAKTGSLNLKKLYQYKLTDDLFQRLTVVPKGKNHGMIMVFDQSGSMDGYYAQTLEQIVVLGLFCRKINIPFHVYGFSDNIDFSDKIPDPAIKNNFLFSQQLNEIALLNRWFNLREYLSHEQSNKDFKAMIERLLLISCVYRNRNRFFVDCLPRSEKLHGTPLNEAIISLLEIIPKFRKAHRLDIVNTILLTDGEGNVINQNWQKTTKNGELKITPEYFIQRFCKPQIIVLRDNETKIEQEVYVNNDNKDGRLTIGLLKLLQRITGARTMGYFISENYRYHIRDWYIKTARNNPMSYLKNLSLLKLVS